MIAMLNRKDKLPTSVTIIPRMHHTRLARTLQDLRRRFGEGSIMQLGERVVNPNVSVISTEFPELDEALGIGGLPRGKIVEIYGPKNSGKTVLCLKVIATCQREGGVCAYIDLEQTLDLGCATRYGVEMTDLYLAQPSSGKEALEIAKALIQAGTKVVIIDSATSLMARAALEDNIQREAMRLRTCLINQALHELNNLTRLSGAVLIITNHVQLKPSLNCSRTEFPLRGMALHFYAAVRIALNPIPLVGSESCITGHRVKATIKKNKLAPPYRMAVLDIL